MGKDAGKLEWHLIVVFAGFVIEIIININKFISHTKQMRPHSPSQLTVDQSSV